jgi:hypothetical protein
MDELPDGVQALIIQKADIPIDTFLYYRRKLGITPKKLQVDKQLSCFLMEHYQKRVDCYKRKKELEKSTNGLHSCAFANYIKKFDMERSIEIIIGEDCNTHAIKFAFRALRTTYDNPLWPELWTIRKTIVDMQTGQETTDWMGDSDYDD